MIYIMLGHVFTMAHGSIFFGSILGTQSTSLWSFDRVPAGKLLRIVLRGQFFLYNQLKSQCHHVSSDGTPAEDQQFPRWVVNGVFSWRNHGMCSEELFPN